MAPVQREARSGGTGRPRARSGNVGGAEGTRGTVKARAGGGGEAAVERAGQLVATLADYGDVEAPGWALPLLVVVGTLAVTASGYLLANGAQAQEDMAERDEGEWFRGKYATGRNKGGDPLKGGKRRRR